MENEIIYSNVKVKRADQLQFLRFIAFGLIFLYHASFFEFSWFPKANGGACAVSFFFILSGLVTAYSSHDSEVELSVSNVKNYVLKKLKKFYPLYLLTTLITVSYSCIPNYIATHRWSELADPLSQFIKSLLLIQSWFPEKYFSYNGVGWFLSTILFLYFLTLPFLSVAWRIRKRKNSSLIFIGILIVTALLTALYNFLMKDTNVEFTQYVLPPARIGEYVCGMCLGFLLYPKTDVSNGKVTSRTVVIYTIAEVMILVFWFASMYVDFPKWMFRSVHWLVPNFMLLGVFTIGKGYVSRLFKHNFLVKLGNLSFGCFLIHPIVVYFYTHVSGIKTNGICGNVFSLVFCLLMTIILAKGVQRRSHLR